MEQSITIRIAGKDFPLKASSPEMERMMRLAAEDINRRLAAYDEKYPDKSFEDKLSFVTLTETVSKLAAQQKLNAIAAEATSLQGDIESYLKKLK